MPGVEKMDERLLAAALVTPFFICMIGFTVAIAFAPAVPNEIAPATEHDHEEIDHEHVSKTVPALVEEISRQIGDGSSSGDGEAAGKDEGEWCAPEK
jgi:hypothetical protein